MKLDREKLVQELCTSFTRRDSMKLKFYLAKGEKNMLAMDKDFTNLREVSDLEL